MKAGGPLSRIRVVLSRPSHPGNIGAAARAMKTMGITRLCLVRPKSFPHPDARAMASGALDALESVEAGAAARELVSAARQDEAAIVFGNETVGLANKEIMRCSALARIPADPEYASLNLAQAVQVIAYELRMAALEPPVPAKKGYATHEEI